VQEDTLLLLRHRRLADGQQRDLRGDRLTHHHAIEVNVQQITRDHVALNVTQKRKLRAVRIFNLDIDQLTAADLGEDISQSEFVELQRHGIKIAPIHNAGHPAFSSQTFHLAADQGPFLRR